MRESIQIILSILIFNYQPDEENCFTYSTKVSLSGRKKLYQLFVSKRNLRARPAFLNLLQHNVGPRHPLVQDSTGLPVRNGKQQSLFQG